MSNSTAMFFIGWSDEDGNNMDAIIEAATLDDALGIWRDEFDLEPDQQPHLSGEIIRTGKAGMMPWDYFRKEPS